MEGALLMVASGMFQQEAGRILALRVASPSVLSLTPSLRTAVEVHRLLAFCLLVPVGEVALKFGLPFF